MLRDTMLTCTCRACCSSLDPSYVSTLSWYFIVMFGLRGVMGLVLGDSSGKQRTHHEQRHCPMPDARCGNSCCGQP